MNPTARTAHPPRGRTRTGAALLAVLVACVVLLAAVTVAVSSARAQLDAMRLSDSGQAIADLRRLAEDATAAWLDAHAGRVVLPPEGGGLDLLHEQFALPEGAGTLHVMLFDGWSGLPTGQWPVGSPLRLAIPLPPGIPLPAHAGAPHRLCDALERLAAPGLPPRFPRPQSQLPLRVWAADATTITAALPGMSVGRNDGRAALATLLSPHATGQINLNTAPIRLVDAAAQVLGLELKDLIARRRSRLFTSAPGAGPERADGLQLVDASPVWNAAVSVTWRGRTARYWLVFAGGSTGHHILQRHACD